jgi:hypothetical protein
MAARDLHSIPPTPTSGKKTSTPVKVPANPVDLRAVLDINPSVLANSPSVVVTLGIEFFINGDWRGARIRRTLNRGLRGREADVSVSAPRWDIGGDQVLLDGLDSRLVLEVEGPSTSVGAKMKEGK